MELAKNKFTHAIAAGEKQIGLWVTLANPFVSEVTAHSGYDWTVIDMEHSPNDYFSVLGQLQAFSSSGTSQSPPQSSYGTRRLIVFRSGRNL